MTRLIGVAVLLLAFTVSIFGQSTPAPAAAAQTPTTTINVNPSSPERQGGPAGPTGATAPNYGFWITYGAMTVVLVVFMIAILTGLRKWSLSAALMDDSATGGPKPSISRLIALLGFAVLISVYLGIGYCLVFRLLSGSSIGDLSGLGSFLLGAAALFAPYLANQIKGAVVGVANAQAAISTGPAPSVTAISPKTCPSGSLQTLTLTGQGLLQIESALCTLENGAEAPIAASNVNVLNSGAAHVSVMMPASSTPGKSYTSTLILLSNAGQRTNAGQFTVT